MIVGWQESPACHSDRRRVARIQMAATPEHGPIQAADPARAAGPFRARPAARAGRGRGGAQGRLPADKTSSSCDQSLRPPSSNSNDDFRAVVRAWQLRAVTVRRPARGHRPPPAGQPRSVRLASEPCQYGAAPTWSHRRSSRRAASDPHDS
jgi:hypothetical protein